MSLLDNVIAATPRQIWMGDHPPVGISRSVQFESAPAAPSFKNVAAVALNRSDIVDTQLDTYSGLHDAWKAGELSHDEYATQAERIAPPLRSAADAAVQAAQALREATIDQQKFAKLAAVNSTLKNLQQAQTLVYDEASKWLEAKPFVDAANGLLYDIAYN